VIRIDSDAAGGHDQAVEKINKLRQRIEAGADFAQVAGQTNDDALLLANKGDPQPGQWMSRGAFVSKPVDDAIWSLQPGQMTNIIDTGESVYLAKLEQRKGGTVQPFEDQEVQDKIYESLRRAQFNTLRQQVRDDLEKKAAIRLNPDMMQVALEMVMQKYPVWAGSAE
jgi:parvulin-like peptidyl-prolyl isomerase